MTTGTIVVFARSPELGRVKTRLEPALGQKRTLALYHAFLQDTLDAARESGAHVVLAHTGGGFDERALADATFEQRGASFGERFDHALAHAARMRPAPGGIIIVGADTPQLGPTRMRHALDALADAPAVIGTSAEGGFHVLGFAKAPVPVASAFDEPFDAPRIIRILLAKKIEVTLVEHVNDVDVPSDFVELLAEIDMRTALGSPWVPTKTAALLATWNARIVRDNDSTRGLRVAFD